VKASRTPALGTALLAAACVTVTPTARSAAPINSCSSSQQCQAYAPGRAPPACIAGICQSAQIGSWTAVVSLSQDAAYAAGATLAVPFSTLLNTVGTCQVKGATCPSGRQCAPLPALVSGSGELVVEPAGASQTQANWNLGNPQMNTVMPVHATFRPQSQVGSSFTDTTAVGLPMGPIDAQDLVDTSPFASPGPGGGPSLLFSFSLPPMPFERTLMPVAPFDQAFPPDIRLVDLSMAPYPDENAVYGCKPPPADCTPFDNINSAMGPTYPTFDLSRADGQPLDGWTAYLQDQANLRRISNAVTLGGTMAKGVRLLTSHHPKSGNALENAALVMQPPSGSSMPTAILQAVNGVLDPTEVYPQLPVPVPVSGTVARKTDGAPVAADVIFESVGLCRDFVSGTTRTVVLDRNPDLAFTTTATAADGSYSAVLPMGVYRATVRPYDTTAQVTAIPNFATTLVLVNQQNQQCGAAAQPGPLVVDVQRTVVGKPMVADGRALADAAVEAIPTACSDNTSAPTCLPRAGGTTTAADGSFSMALDPGAYLLRVRPAEGSALPWVVTPLAVGPSTVTKASGIPPVPAPFDAGLVLQDPVACNPVVEAVVRMYETPAMGPAFEIGEALTDSTGHYDMYLAPPAQ
jgi:hypothetical protein